MSQEIICEAHGKGADTFVCEHLVSNPRQEWFSAEPSEENPWPDAWCLRCHESFEREGEWNEKNEDTLKATLLCSSCYESKRAHQTSADWDDFLREATEYLHERQQRLQSQFSLSKWEKYYYDLEARTLAFSTAGSVRVLADIEIVGSISMKTGTWLWSWENEGMPEPSKQSMLHVRAFGRERRLRKLTTAMWSGDEADGWEMTAASAYVLRAEGAYRSPEGQGALFMILRNVHWVS
jgi:hypothetical protein